MGCTSVLFIDFLMGGIGMVPNIFAYCFVGASVERIVEVTALDAGSNQNLLILTVVGLIMILIAFSYIAWIAKREIQSLTDETNEERERLQNIDDIDDDINDGNSSSDDMLNMDVDIGGHFSEDEENIPFAVRNTENIDISENDEMKRMQV